MIVRISGEDQYQLPDEDAGPLNELEAAVVSALEGGSESDFDAAFAALLEHVRAKGSVIADEDIHSSDVILPPADLSYAEAGVEFTGEGLIPD